LLEDFVLSWGLLEKKQDERDEREHTGKQGEKKDEFYGLVNSLERGLQDLLRR
jgi:hypothetical protein